MSHVLWGLKGKWLIYAWRAGKDHGQLAWSCRMSRIVPGREERKPRTQRRVLGRGTELLALLDGWGPPSGVAAPVWKSDPKSRTEFTCPAGSGEILKRTPLRITCAKRNLAAEKRIRVRETRQEGSRGPAWSTSTVEGPQHRRCLWTGVGGTESRVFWEVASASFRVTLTKYRIRVRRGWEWPWASCLAVGWRGRPVHRAGLREEGTGEGGAALPSTCWAWGRVGCVWVENQAQTPTWGSQMDLEGWHMGGYSGSTSATGWLRTFLILKWL